MSLVEDAQRTRIAAKKKLDQTKSTHLSQEERAVRRRLCEDCCILFVLAVQPPDRVGVIRRLSRDKGGTLIKAEGDSGWLIDRTKFRHKVVSSQIPTEEPLTAVTFADEQVLRAINHYPLRPCRIHVGDIPGHAGAPAWVVLV